MGTKFHMHHCLILIYVQIEVEVQEIESVPDQGRSKEVT